MVHDAEFVGLLAPFFPALGGVAALFEASTAASGILATDCHYLMDLYLAPLSDLAMNLSHGQD